MTATQGDLLADTAIARAAANADSDWMLAARRAVWQLIQAGEAFTTDAVWQLLDEAGVGKPREPRALGAVLRAAARAGFLEKTGSYFKSSRPDCHSRPVPLWLPRKKAAA